MGINGQKAANEFYSWTTEANKFVEFYTKLKLAENQINL